MLRTDQLNLFNISQLDKTKNFDSMQYFCNDIRTCQKCTLQLLVSKINHHTQQILKNADSICQATEISE